MIAESESDAQFKVIRLSEEYPLSTREFDCGDLDLNEFLVQDSLNLQNQLLSVTYIIENEVDSLIGYFSVFNDKLTAEDLVSVRNKLQRKIPNRKRFSSYPCVKIGRLGVHKEYKGKQFGTSILDYVKVLFLTKNKTGCRFITVDAYSQSVVFYEKNGFKFLTDKDEGEKTRQMYFDLMSISI